MLDVVLVLGFSCGYVMGTCVVKEIRVLRKWITNKKKELRYLFVNRHGHAIEAVADETEQPYFDSIIKMLSFYNVDNYVCITSRTYMAVVDHVSSPMIKMLSCQVSTTKRGQYTCSLLQLRSLRSAENQNQGKQTAQRVIEIRFHHILVSVFAFGEVRRRAII